METKAKKENILQYIVQVEAGDEKNEGEIKNKKKMFNKNDEKKIKIIGAVVCMVSVCNYETLTKDTKKNKNDNKELYHKCESSVYRQIFYLLEYVVREFLDRIWYDTRVHDTF